MGLLLSWIWSKPGNTTTLTNGITVSKYFSVSGTFDPDAFLVTLTGATFTLETTGIIKVKAGNYAANYSIAPGTIDTGSTVEYAASDRSQTIAAFANGKLFLP